MVVAEDARRFITEVEAGKYGVATDAFNLSGALPTGVTIRFAARNVEPVSVREGEPVYRSVAVQLTRSAKNVDGELVISIVGSDLIGSGQSKFVSPPDDQLEEG